MSFKFIRDHADRWPIRLMCRVLEVLGQRLLWLRHINRVAAESVRG